MKRLSLLLIFISTISFAQVHTSYLWHLQQPNYWPDKSLSNPFEYQKVWESNILKFNGGNNDINGLAHPTNDLQQIFSKPDRVNVYQWEAKNAMQRIAHLPEAGVQVNYGGCLIENMNSLANNNAWGYQSNWQNHIISGQNNLTSDGYSRMNITGFTWHHSLSPLLSDRVLKKEIQAHKSIVQSNFNGNISKGYWPAECAFSERIIKVLVEEGFEWSIIANSHLARTLNDYEANTNFGTNGINIDPPNKADKITTNGNNWFNGQIDGRGGSFAAPYCYQVHKAKYVDPNNGTEYVIDVVPMAELMSYRDGFSEQGTGEIDTNIAPFNDNTQPSLVLFAHDGDNAWGGGSSYYDGAVANFSNSANAQGYVPSNIQEFIDEHPTPTNDIVHVEDGAWFNAANDWGHPQFINWLWPMYDSNYEFNPNGWTEDARNWAVLTAAENFVVMAEDLEPNIQISDIVNPTAASSDVELAWHFLLPGYTSGYMYYGDAEDMEIKQTVAANNAVDYAQNVINAHNGTDTTSPSVFIPQRYPYNPGEIGFGPTYAYQQHQNSANFTIWTFAFDVNGITSAKVKYRIDNDGTNPLNNNDNETYAGGNSVGAWQDITMNERIFPKENVTNNPNIDFYILPDFIANEYYAEITGLSEVLVDYYVEVIDTNGNITKSKIQHVWVGTNTQTTPEVTILPENNFDPTQIDVTISATDDNSTPTIYYTTDGTEPTTSSTWGTGTVNFSLTETNTVKAMAVDTDGNQSETVTKTYYIGVLDSFSVYFKPPTNWTTTPLIYHWAASPIGNLANANWPGYTMTDVGSGWFRYDFTNIASTNIIFNNGSGGNDNQTADLFVDTEAWFDWNSGFVSPQNLEDPIVEILPMQENYTVGDTVQITINANDSTDANPSIYYTIDGTEPTTSSTLVQTTVSFNITETTTIKAFAKDTDNNESAILTKNYVFNSANDITVYFKSGSGWPIPKIYWWNDIPSGSAGVSNWPGIDMQVHDSEWYKYEFSGVQQINVIFNNGNGGAGNQTDDLEDITTDLWYEWNVGVLETNDDELNVNEVLIYPNPFENEINLVSNHLFTSYQIYSLLGSKISFGKIESNKIILKKTISNGVYFIKLADENGKYIIKKILK